MTTRKHTVLGLVTALTLGTGVADAAMAGSDEQENNQAENQAISAASVSLSDATRIAEQKVGGKAEDAGIENRDDKSFFWDVKVRGINGKVQKVLVDMKTGKIAKVMADDNEHEGNEKGETGENRDGDEDHKG